MDFKLGNLKNEEEKVYVLPRSPFYNKCLPQEFEHVTRTSPDKYFAIWGCHQISESQYNRGLWVFRPNKNKTDYNVENARQVITEALTDMDLAKTTIWENMIINVNKFAPRGDLNCTIKRHNEQCNTQTDSSPTSVSMRSVPMTKEETFQINLPLFMFICVMIVLSITVILLMYKCK